MSALFRQFQVVKKVVESTVITSFYLQPDDKDALWPAQPGQYLTLRIPTTNKPVLRTYSLSMDTANNQHYRITVKREAAPTAQADAPDGVGSCWLHDTIKVGSKLDVASPRGTFVLDENSERPVLLLSGGVGQTPLLSMLHSLAKTSRKVWSVHACQSGAEHAMQNEVNVLVEQSDGRIHSSVVYSQPSEEDHMRQAFDSSGYIDKTLLQTLLPLDDYDVYLCGPTAFMVAIYKLLLELGVAKPRIAYEFFGQATPLDALAFSEQTTKASPIAASKAPDALANLAHITNPGAWESDKILGLSKSQSPNPAHRDSQHSTATKSVYFSRSKLTAEWSESNTSLLQLAEQNGLTPDFSCRSGICNSCLSTLLEGEVEYRETPLESPNKDKLLLCCSRPLGRVVIDL